MGLTANDIKGRKIAVSDNSGRVVAYYAESHDIVWENENDSPTHEGVCFFDASSKHLIGCIAFLDKEEMLLQLSDHDHDTTQVRQPNEPRWRELFAQTIAEKRGASPLGILNAVKILAWDADLYRILEPKECDGLSQSTFQDTIASKANATALQKAMSFLARN